MDSRKTIILDRDGVINHDSKEYIKSPEEWLAIPGSLEAIARLSKEDYQVVVITNQSGISRGYYTINTLNRIHQKMMEELHHLGGEVSAIFFCPHNDQQQCDCRKPKPGMFLELSKRLKCNLKEVYAVGDSIRDLQAARAAGANPVLVETGNGKTTVNSMEEDSKLQDLQTVPIYADLSDFVDHLLNVSVN